MMNKFFYSNSFNYKQGILSLLFALCSLTVFGQNIVSGGVSHSIAIKSDGTLWAWGNNGDRRLGNGTTTSQTAPIQIGTATWKAVAAGLSHTLAIKTDGTLWAWGSNGNGHLGNGTTTAITVPTQIGTDTWSQVVCSESSGSDGNAHTVGIKSDGTLWAWGSNSFGQLGDGTTTTKRSPTQVGTDTWKTVVAGSAYTVGIKTNGTLWAWGSNSSGKLGDGTTTNISSPTQIGTDTWSKVAAGQNSTFAIRSDGTLWAWGSNWTGQLGDGTTTDKNTPTQIGSSTWLAVDAGQTHTLAIRSDGTLWTWGSNGDGQLGNGTTTASNSPVQIGTATNWTLVAGGFRHSMAANSAQELWAWGSNFAGQVGNATTTNQTSPVLLSLNVLVLPVELVSFEGYNKGGVNILNWATANEQNNKGFQVERLNGNNWEILGFKTANNKASTYQFTDNTPLSISSYRLSQIDNDGKETFSKTITIQRSDKRTFVAVYPNPVSNVLNIETNTEGGYFQLFNMYGQQVLSGKTAQPIDVSALPQGTYFVKVGSEQAKFIKQ
jgi:alpha-tubulin suppressor-like RCC1 family protein